VTGALWGAVGAVVALGALGNVWLLRQEALQRRRRVNTVALVALSVGSAVIVVASSVYARPWWWDVVTAAVAIASLGGVGGCLRALWGTPRPRGWRSGLLAAGALGFGALLMAMGATLAVLDGAAIAASGQPRLGWHGGAVLEHPVLYQIFWGPQWAGPSVPARDVAVAFQRQLPTSRWAAAVARSGFGVESFAAGGCWVDPAPPPHPGVPATGTASGPFADEVRAVLSGTRPVAPCPGAPATSLPAAVPAEAVVALWLSPDVPYALGGLAAHGALPWPGLPHGLAATGLPGAYAWWHTPACRLHPACDALPPLAAPTYALSHELLETATNPFGHGWYANAPLQWTARYALRHGPPSLFGPAPVYLGEVADLCEPGAPAAGDRVLVGRLDPGGPPTAAFDRPGLGCVT